MQKDQVVPVDPVGAKLWIELVGVVLPDELLLPIEPDGDGGWLTPLPPSLPPTPPPQPLPFFWADPEPLELLGPPGRLSLSVHSGGEHGNSSATFQ